MKNYILLILVILINSNTIFSQKNDFIYTKPDTLFLSKNECSCNKVGFKISIAESKHNNPINNNCTYIYKNLFEADIKLKINLVNRLLEFKMDNSISCCKVKCYRNIALKYEDSIISRNYPLNMSALYHINLICFGTFATYYAPFPILYNKTTKKEINNNDIEIQNVFDIYIKWFQKCKETNFSDYVFPLQNTEYCWKYGSSILKHFYDLPIIASDLKDKIGKPIN